MDKIIYGLAGSIVGISLYNTLFEDYKVEPHIKEKHVKITVNPLNLKRIFGYGILGTGGYIVGSNNTDISIIGAFSIISYNFYKIISNKDIKISDKIINKQLEKEKEKLINEISDLQNEIEQLEMQIAHEVYKPGGSGYVAAKESFNGLNKN
jgi:hypothetical protein